MSLLNDCMDFIRGGGKITLLKSETLKAVSMVMERGDVKRVLIINDRIENNTPERERSVQAGLENAFQRFYEAELEGK